MQRQEELQIHKGSKLGNLYNVEAFLGQGCFGVVTKCRNTETGEHVAIKVNKNDPQIFHQAREEIEILKELQSLDPDTCNIIRWNGFFFNEVNVCLNFELLDQSLFDYVAELQDQLLPMKEVRSVVSQLNTALLHLSSKGIVHADLKTENVMVVDRTKKPLRVKLIDFGLAHAAYTTEPGACVQTKWYRAPEVSLLCPFNEAIDMWSLGHLAAELATGYPLYPGNLEYDVVHFIVQSQGQPPDHVLDQGRRTEHFFYHQSDGEQRWRFKTPEEFRLETGFQPSDTRHFWLRSLDDLLELMDINRGKQSDNQLLVDLIKRMMDLDPERRIKPLGVMQHPFLSECSPQSSSAEVVIDMTATKDHQQPSRYQTEGSEEIHPAVNHNDSDLPAEPVDNTGEEEDVQPGNRGRNVGWFRRAIRRLRKNVCSFFRRRGDRSSNSAV